MLEIAEIHKFLIEFMFILGCRPSLGCRILVQRHLFNIVPALVRDIDDWVPETRIKSSQVLFSLILHAEDKMTIKLPSALEGILKGAGDEKKEVVEHVRFII